MQSAPGYILKHHWESHADTQNSCVEFEILSTFSMSSAVLNFGETLLTGRQPVWALAKGTADTAMLGFGWIFLVPSESAG